MAIDKTLFYTQLQEIHKKTGIPLQREPILGGQKLDLMKIYEQVQLLGGFQKVNETNQWRLLGAHFQLPATCTNSAFVFKRLYKRHLYIYEQMQQTDQSIDQIINQVEKPKQTEIIKVAQRSTAVIEENEEKYLQGGWQNRLALSLKSNLPNELDWAFSKLIKLSYLQNFYVGFIPSLPETLLHHCKQFFDELSLNTSPNDFETSLRPGLEVYKIPIMSEMAVFNIPKKMILLERVLQSLHVIRNMSFMNENAIAFSRDHNLLTVLAKSMALPPVTYYIEIQQYALDIFENISSLLVLRGPSDFYLACLKKMIFDSDRSRLLVALRSLICLTNEKNEKIILLIDTPVLQRLLQLLLVPDEDIVVQVMVLKLLLKIMNWRGFGIETFSATIQRPEASTDYKAPVAPSTLDPRVVDAFHAAMWLQTMCVADTTVTLTHDQLYIQYCQYCTLNLLNPVPLSELLKMVVKFYKEGSVQMEPPMILGIKPLIKLNESLENNGGADDIDETPETKLKPNQQVIGQGYEELKGIPLLAILVIRNIARNEQNHGFFLGVEKDLVSMLLHPNLNKSVSSILAELK